MNRNDGGPAFPQMDRSDPMFPKQLQGMSLRDWFAGQALVGILANKSFVGPFTDSDPPWDLIAMDALNAADAMLKAREQQ